MELFLGHQYFVITLKTWKYCLAYVFEGNKKHEYYALIAFGSNF